MYSKYTEKNGYWRSFKPNYIPTYLSTFSSPAICGFADFETPYCDYDEPGETIHV
jgi:hypothetical protein